MAKKSKTPPQQKKRPKGAGNEEPPAKRVRKQAAKPTDLASPSVKRCGQQGCPVCDAQPCNKCYRCREAAEKGWDLAKRCKEANAQREKTCPNRRRRRATTARTREN